MRNMQTMFIVLFVSIFVPVCLSLSVGPRDVLSKKYFDLSYAFDEDTIYFPGQRQYELNMDYANVSRAGFMYKSKFTSVQSNHNDCCIVYRYSAYSFCMGEHGGTHLDAPIHFNVNGWTVDQIPATRLIDVPAVLIDVETDVNGLEKTHEFVFDVNHVVAFEKAHGTIPFGSVVLIHTGWSKYWPDKGDYLGWDNSTETLNFPGEISRSFLLALDAPVDFQLKFYRSF